MLTNTRLPEIDIARVIAITLMIAFHIAYDLSTYYDIDMNVHSGAWWLTGKASAIAFLFLSGMSFSLSWTRTPHWKKYIKRGSRIFSYGLLITMSTYIINPDTYVRFGILHLIGISIIILPYIVRLQLWNIVTGVLAILIGLGIKEVQGTKPFMLIFGLMPESFVSIDYFPIFPWIGVVILGSVLGQLYLQFLPNRTLAQSDSAWLAGFTFISKKSLLIYLVHQPLIMLTLWLILGKPT